MSEMGSSSANITDKVLSVAPPTVGSFRFWFAGHRWDWSEEVYRMHGYSPGGVIPTTELLLSHKHPDDRDNVAKTIARAVEQGEAFSSRHRFLDTTGAEHDVMVVADRVLDDSGAVVGTAGFYIDLTATLTATRVESEREAVSETLPELIETRAVIEQAKGVLMRMYRIDADQAFKVLAWRSQETNTKLRDLAAQLIADLTQLPPAAPATINIFDHLLLTAHERLATTGQRDE